MKRVLLILLVVVGIVFAQIRFFVQGSVLVNPYSPVVLNFNQVKGFYVYSSEVNYKLAINGDNYTPMQKGGAFNFNNLNIEKLTLKIQGATGTDTGIVHYIIAR